jgi:hypothetical protein
MGGKENIYEACQGINMLCTFFNKGIKSLEPSLTKHIHANVGDYMDNLKESLEYKGIALTKQKQ